MLRENLAKRLTIYIDEAERYRGKPVYEALMDLFSREKIAGMSVFRGLAGYGADRVVHTAKMLELATSLPLKIEAVDSEEMIRRVLPAVSEIVTKGLVEISDATIVTRFDTESGSSPL